MRVDETLPVPSLKPCCDHSQKSNTLGSSCSTIDSNEQEQQPIARMQRSRSFKVLKGKIANAIKPGSQGIPDETASTTSSKPVRARLVLKKKGGQQPSPAQPQTPSRAGRRIVVRRKSFFGMSKDVDASTPADGDTHAAPKRRAVTPARSGRRQEIAPVTPSKKAMPRISSTSKTFDQTPVRKISLLHKSCRSVQREIRLPGVESPRRDVSRISADFLQNSRRNLTVQDIIDEYNKIAGEGPEIEC